MPGVSDKESCGRARASVLGLLVAPLASLVLLVLLAVCLWPGTAVAQEHRISEAEAIRVADRDSNAVKERELNGPLAPIANVVDGQWEVAYFVGGEEVALVIVDRESGEVRESWTGYQVAWKMARGYSGSFGHKLNAPYVFLPLCLIFLIGLVDWRRLWRVANLDLLVLLGFGISHFFFNRAEIGVSVPLQYPALLYLLGRALWIGFRGRGEGLRPVWPVAWMLVAALFLMGFRVGLNLADSGAIDVGYASVVGADRVTHGEPIYDNFPEDVSQGDTYGPVNYYAYVPSELIWPWSGSWDDLPAAHGAAVTFDIATFLLLILLGLRIRPGPAGRRLAAILAFGWAAYPYTAFALESNSNDTLVAMLLVATLVLLGEAARPGGDGGARDLRQVRPGPTGTHASHLRIEKALDALLRRRLRAGERRRDALAGHRPRSAHGLRQDDRLPVEPRFAVQRLGASALPGAPPHRDPRRGRGPVFASGLPPAAQVPGSGGGPWGCPPDLAPADHAALVLPLHRLVLPLAPDCNVVPREQLRYPSERFALLARKPPRTATNSPASKRVRRGIGAA